ncbi:hypothetical protein AB0M79_09775 [Polymorphospora sp. NPDC051019]
MESFECGNLCGGMIAVEKLVEKEKGWFNPCVVPCVEAGQL